MTIRPIGSMTRTGTKAIWLNPIELRMDRFIGTRSIKRLSKESTGEGKMAAAVAAIRSAARRSYPAQIIGRPYPWFSNRQRWYVTHAIQEGLIHVPRTRTGRLALSWKMEVKWSGTDIVGRVWSDLSYAAYVMGKQQAKEMAARGWQTIDAISERVFRVYRDGIIKAAQGRD